MKPHYLHLFAWLLAAASTSAAPLPVAKLDRQTPVSFYEEIVPVLKANCTACHNKTTTKGGLNMETPALMLKGGESGAAIVPGKGSESLLLQSAMHDSDSDMPPKGNKVGAVNLSPQELALLKLWLDQGAKAGEKKAATIAWQPLPPGLNPIYAVAMSPGGELAACSRANQVFIYDVQAKKPVAQFVAHRDVVCSLAFSPDGTRLASGSFGEVKLWKADKPLPAPTPASTLTHDAGVAALDVAFLTTEVASQEKEVTAMKDRVKKANDAIADTKKKVTEKQDALTKATQAREAAQKAHNDASAAVEKQPKDKPDAALTKKQETAKEALDNANRAETKAKSEHDAAITAAKDAVDEVLKIQNLQSDTEKQFATTKAALTAAQAKQKKLTADLAAAQKAAPAAPAPALPAAWTLERTLGTGENGSPVTDRANALDFSPDGKTLAIGCGSPSRDGDILFWNLADGKVTQTLADRHSDAVLSLSWSPDGTLIASGGADKQLRVSEVKTGKLLKTLEGHTHHVMGVSWRADGRVLASGGADNAVKVWDWLKGERRKSLEGWDKEVTSVHYLGTSTRVATTSGDKQVRLIGEDASSPAVLPGTTGFMNNSAASANGERLAAGGEDSVLRVWDVKTAKEWTTFPAPDSTAAK